MKKEALLLIISILIAFFLTNESKLAFREKSKLCSGSIDGSGIENCEYAESSGWPFKYKSGFTAQQNPFLPNFAFYLIVSSSLLFILNKFIKSRKKVKRVK